MTKEATLIFEKVKADILSGPYIAWNFDYYRGYCAAIEETNLLPRGSVFKEVKAAALKLCEDQRQKNKLSLF